MKKPERIYFRSGDSPQDKVRYDRIGYNRACDDWEKFLPSEKKILTILIKEYKKAVNKGAFKHLELFMKLYFLPDLARAISKRIKGGKR